MNTVYVRFDKNLDYRKIVNSELVHHFCEGVFGERPTMVTPTKFTFDRDKLGKYIQDQYDKSKEYVMESKRVPGYISVDYCERTGHPEDEGHLSLYFKEFEPETLLDDHIITINKGDKVLGVFATEDDFEHIIAEL